MQTILVFAIFSDILARRHNKLKIILKTNWVEKQRVLKIGPKKKKKNTEPITYPIKIPLFSFI